MTNYKVVVGVLALVIGIVAYWPYFKDIYAGKTKPHSFSWLLWALEQTIGFFAQFSKGAGAGSWVTGVTALLCFWIFIISLSKGEKNITLVDKLSLVGAILGLVLWVATKNPLLAVIFVSIADLFAFIPTFRKTYTKPFEESVSIYACYALVWLLSILALQNYNPTTVIYPASLLLTNSAFVTMQIIRRNFYGPPKSNLV